MGYKAVVQIRENLKTLMRIHHVDQKAVALAIGRHPTTLNKFLQGTREIQLKDLDALADFFGIRPYELFQPGGSTLTERRSGQDRRAGRERRIGHAHRLMTAVSVEVVRHWRKGPAQLHGETTPASDPAAALEALVTEFEQRAAPLLAAADAVARGQVADHRGKLPPVPPAVRPAGRSHPRKG
jgi:transcriptional regulator with XRE-family HTH domain